MHLEIHHSYTKIVGASSGDMEVIRRSLTYKCPWAKFSPAYRQKRWDGTKTLLLRSKGQYYLPSGLVGDVCGAISDVELDDRREYPYQETPALKPLMEMEYRDFQVPACEALLSGKRGILWVPTGGGKTAIMCGVIRTLDLPTLWLTREERLANQTAQVIREQCALNTAVLQGMSGRSELPGDQVVVAMVQTISRNLKRLGEWLQRFQVVISDECFPAGTLVDGLPIQDLRVGDLVCSFDGKSISSARINRIFCSQPRSLVKIRLISGETIVCTASHPFFTQRGYVPAILMVRGDSVAKRCFNGQDVSSEVYNLRQRFSGELCECQIVRGRVFAETVVDATEEAEESRYFTLRRLRHAGSLFRAHRTYLRKKRAGVLLDRLPQQIYERSEATRLSGTCNRACCAVVSSNAGKESKLGPAGSPEDFSHASAETVSSACSRGEWATITGATAITGRSSWVADGGSYSDPETCGKRLSLVLQVGCRRREFNDRDRSGWDITQNASKEVSGRKEIPAIDFVGVDDIEILEPGSDGRFGGLCPDGKVYNIEVEGNHNYFANNFLVHNCHGASSPTFYKVLMSCQAPYRYGCSGTPLERSDENCLSLIGATGPVLYHAEFEDVKDYLSQPLVRMLTVPSPAISLPWLEYKSEALSEGMSSADAEAAATRRYWSEAYDLAIVKDTWRNAKVTELAIAGMHKRQPTVVFVSRVEHGKALQENLASAVGPENVDYLYGDVPGPVRESMWSRLASGSLPILVCGDKVGGEGIDVPELKRIVVASGLKAPIIVKQRIGRSMRPKEDNSRPEIFDFLDQHCKMLEKHALARIRAYKEQGAEVVLGT